MADLRGLASLCKFGTLEDKLVQDQLAEHIDNLKLSKWLPTMPDDLYLSEVVDVALRLESAAALASQLVPISTSPSPKTMLLAQIVAPLLEASESVLPKVDTPGCDNIPGLY